jgi:hypothetical protein
MHNIKVRTVSGRTYSLNFNDYTYLEYIFNGAAIIPGSKLIDANGEIFIVERISINSVKLRDADGTIYNYGKDSIKHLRGFNNEY